MPASAGPSADSSHPSPHRDRVGLVPLFFGLWIAPAAWAGQLIVDYGLASYACYPRYAPQAHAVPGWGGLWWGLLAINIVAILAAAAGALVSYRDWQATREEHPGHFGHVLEAGIGRSRFLSLLGIMTSVGFLAAIVFDLIVLLVVPLCG